MPLPKRKRRQQGREQTDSHREMIFSFNNRKSIRQFAMIDDYESAVRLVTIPIPIRIIERLEKSSFKTAQTPEQLTLSLIVEGLREIP